MTDELHADIRRRPDGSIDTDFYACRAAHMRNEALRTEPARWLRRMSRLAGRLVARHGPVMPAPRARSR
jgi:hypothetical protein